MKNLYKDIIFVSLNKLTSQINYKITLATDNYEDKCGSTCTLEVENKDEDDDVEVAKVEGT